MSLQQNKLNTLVIDDDPVYRNLLRSILKEKINVFAVESPSTAFKIMKNERIDIIICDFKLPEMNGLKVLEKVKNEYQGIEVIMISNSGDIDTVIGALRNGAADFFKKPFTATELWLSIERTRKFSELNANLDQFKKRNTLLKAEVNRELGHVIIGKSASINSIKQQMQMVAKTPDTSVLIIGESGTGKELVARGIHNMSDRKDEMFGAINMSAVPESLFESEFFGHKKGSFTGAIADKAGWFETINDGTLFFDEIGEISKALQVKLLRVLEDRKFTSLGTQNEQSFDIRIVAATNKTVEELTLGKEFRLDLFHRLGTFIINLPPLRERKRDIPELVEYFLGSLVKKMGKHISGIHPEVYELLNNYDFPGNIRELKNLLERAVIVCQSDQLLAQHFISHSIPGAGTGKDTTNQIDNDFDLKEVEKQTIIRALKEVNYNKAEAARLLNLEWNALYRRIQKHGIELPS
jgi:DNA-binding NtrC family response regulator